MPSIFDYVPWWLAAGGGAGLVAVLFAGVWYYTGSLKAALTASATLGAVLLLALAKKKGRAEGIAAERQRAAEQSRERASKREEIVRDVEGSSASDLDRRGRRWLRD